MNTDPTAADVLDFWFGPAPMARRAEWFRKDPAFDALIRQRFGPAVEAALAGQLQGWAESPPGALALIVLLDQFTRNIFRDTPRAFAGDVAALALARRMVAQGWDRALPPVQRSFAYLPYEHCEDLAVQQESLRLFEALAAADPAQADTLDYAQRHQAVIARFGRYPHRNAILGRTSTAEEVAFLAQPGSGF